MSKFQHQIVACLIFCYVIRLTTGNKRNPFSACASKESNIIQWRARIAECLTNLNECLLEEGLKQGRVFVIIANDLAIRIVLCIYFLHMLVLHKLYQ